MPIYPSSGYDNLMTKSQLTVDNVAVHQEINYQTNADGTPVVVNPTDTLNNTTSILSDLSAEIVIFYAAPAGVGGMSSIGGNEQVTGSNPSWTGAPVDFFTNLKQIKLRRLQTQCKLLCFELKRLTNECNKIATLGVNDLPSATPNRYPSSKRVTGVW